MQIPTVMDPSLAPEGFHIATTYGFFFPCEAPRDDRGRLRDEMVERILDRLSELLPDLRDCIVERAIFSSDHFAAMQGATNGDFTHGLIHPEQMIGRRLLVPGSAYATPIANLYLCGASCHPGPGVTFLPRYGAAYQVAEALGTLTRSSARSAAWVRSSIDGRSLRFRSVHAKMPPAGRRRSESEFTRCDDGRRRCSQLKLGRALRENSRETAHRSRRFSRERERREFLSRAIEFGA